MQMENQNNFTKKQWEYTPLSFVNKSTVVIIEFVPGFKTPERKKQRREYNRELKQTHASIQTTSQHIFCLQQTKQMDQQWVPFGKELKLKYIRRKTADSKHIC